MHVGTIYRRLQSSPVSRGPSSLMPHLPTASHAPPPPPAPRNLAPVTPSSATDAADEKESLGSTRLGIRPSSSTLNLLCGRGGGGREGFRRKQGGGGDYSVWGAMRGPHLTVGGGLGNWHVVCRGGRVPQRQCHLVMPEVEQHLG